MNIDDVLTLCRAGFTAEQIGAMAQIKSGDSAPTPEPAPAPTPAPSPEPTPAPTPAPSPEPTPAQNDTQAMLAEMLGLMRKGNIGGMSYAEKPQEDPAEMMAAILAPTPKVNK